jgi:hypothetical protein
MMVNRTSSNSGAIDFNIMIIIANHLGVILKDPIQAVTVCCVGGSWFDTAYGLRVAGRINFNPNNRLNLNGFRCVSGF